MKDILNTLELWYISVKIYSLFFLRQRMIDDGVLTLVWICLHWLSVIEVDVMLFLLPNSGSVLMFAVGQNQTNKPGVGKKKNIWKFRKIRKNWNIYTWTWKNVTACLWLLLMISVGEEHKNCWAQCGNAGSSIEFFVSVTYQVLFTCTHKSLEKVPENTKRLKIEWAGAIRSSTFASKTRWTGMWEANMPK